MDVILQQILDFYTGNSSEMNELMNVVNAFELNELINSSCMVTMHLMKYFNVQIHTKRFDFLLLAC